MAGNKNAALPILAACLLTEEELPSRVPRIRDTEARSRCSSSSGSRLPGSPITASGSALAG